MTEHYIEPRIDALELKVAALQKQVERAEDTILGLVEGIVKAEFEGQEK